MIYSGSIIFVDPAEIEKAKEILAEFPEIDVHAASEDKQQIVVSIETESDASLEELTAKIKSYGPVLDVGHHIMHFEEEVEEILQGKKVPDLKKFSRSSRREKHPLENKEV